MGRRKNTGEDYLREREALRDRVKLLLDARWQGNQRAMARDIAVSQSLLSKVVNGSQRAGPRLLEAIGRQPGIEVEWLLNGRGKTPFVAMRGTLPVAVGILPGPPSAHVQLLTGDRHPVAEAMERPTRYWLAVQTDSPLLEPTELKIATGDFLLIETDSEWTSRDDLLAGRLCALRLRRGDACSYVWAIVGREADQLKTTVLAFLQKPEANEHTIPPVDTQKRRRHVRLADPKQVIGTPQPPKPLVVEPVPAADRPAPGPERPDVVGICLALDRPYPGTKP